MGERGITATVNGCHREMEVRTPVLAIVRVGAMEVMTVNCLQMAMDMDKD